MHVVKFLLLLVHLQLCHGGKKRHGYLRVARFSHASSPPRPNIVITEATSRTPVTLLPAHTVCKLSNIDFARLALQVCFVWAEYEVMLKVQFEDLEFFFALTLNTSWAINSKRPLTNPVCCSFIYYFWALRYSRNTLYLHLSNKALSVSYCHTSNLHGFRPHKGFRFHFSLSKAIDYILNRQKRSYKEVDLEDKW